MKRTRLVQTLVVGVAVGLAGLAEARSSAVLSYPPAEVWPTAVRYLRIDRGATVKEKDAESGYVLFELPEGQKVYKGSLELVRTTDGDDRESTRVVVNLTDLPRHFELTLLEKLTAKVKEEYGSPAPAPAKKPSGETSKRPPPDAGVLPRPTPGELPRPERRP
jgi:hypothetical protein